MKILLINHYAGSILHGMEYRPYYLAKEWVKIGHQVTVISASYSHLRNRQPEINSEITEENIEGIRYVWLNTPYYVGNGFRRVLNMISFAIKLYKYGYQIMKENPPDVVIASSPHPFIIYGAKKIARDYNAKLIFEVRDLWPTTLIELGNISPIHPFILFMKYTERMAYRASDCIVSLLPKVNLYLEEIGVLPKNYQYVPNGVDVEEWEKSNSFIPEEHLKVLHQLRSNNKFIVGYVGSHGVSNALQNLINAASLLISEPVHFVLVGKGPEKGVLEQETNKMGLRNITFLPPVPKASIPALLNQMDALYIGWNRQNFYKYGISPNKLMDYMMAGKPIIHAVEAGNDLVKESGCGISVSPDDPKAICKAILDLLKMSVEERHEVGKKGRLYCMKHHDYKVLAKKYLECINSIL